MDQSSNKRARPTDVDSRDVDSSVDLSDIMNQPIVLRHQIRSLNVALTGRDDTINDLKRDIEQLNKHNSRNTRVLNKLLAAWDNMNTDCQYLYNQLQQYNTKHNISSNAQINGTHNNVSALHKCILGSTDASRDKTSLIDSDNEIDELIQHRVTVSTNMLKSIVNVIDNINGNADKIQTTDQLTLLQSTLTDSHTQHKQLQCELARVNEQAVTAQQQVIDLTTALNSKTADYNTLHKQYARLKTDYEFNSNTNKSQSPQPTNNNNTVKQENGTTSNEPQNTATVELAVHQQLRAEMQEYKSLSNVRLNELESLRVSEQQLQSQIQALKRQPPSDTQIRHSQVYIACVESYEALKRQWSDQELLVQQLRNDVNMLQQSVSRTDDIHQSQIDTITTQYNNAVNKYQIESQELREQLLSCYAQLELANSKLSKQGPFSDQAYEHRTALLQTLEAQNSKLQSDLNTLKAEREWCSTTVTSSQQTDLAFMRHIYYTECHRLVTAARIKQSDVERQLNTYSRLSSDVTKHVQAIGQLKAERDSAHRELSKLKQQEADIRAYINKTSDTDKIILELRGRADEYEYQVQSMRNALDSTAEEYTALQTTNSKLSTMQVQHDHTIQQLHQLTMQQQMQPHATKLASDLYNSKLKVAADQLKHVNDTVNTVKQDNKLKDEQIKQLQQQITQLQSSVDYERDLLIKQQQQISEWKSLRDSTKHQIDTLQNEYNECNDKLSNATLTCKSHLEQLTVLQNKYTQLQNQYKALTGGNTALASKGLQAELNQYKDKIKCSVCSLNDKDTVLTSCYHAFCQSCINENVKSRNRKCGACGLKFSDGDIKPLYLASGDS